VRVVRAALLAVRKEFDSNRYCAIFDSVQFVLLIASTDSTNFSLSLSSFLRISFSKVHLPGLDRFRGGAGSGEDARLAVPHPATDDDPVGDVAAAGAEPVLRRVRCARVRAVLATSRLPVRAGTVLGLVVAPSRPGILPATDDRYEYRRCGRDKINKSNKLHSKDKAQYREREFLLFSFSCLVSPV